MPHIHTEPGQHDLTNTAFIIRIENKNAFGLLHMHKKLKFLLPVGGHVELNENPWASVIHEVEEESGYRIEQLRVLQPKERITRLDRVKIHPIPLFFQTHEYTIDMGHFHTDTGFLFITDQLPLHRPEKGESADLLWLTNKEIQARKSEMPPDIAQIYDFAFKVALENWEPVSPNSFDV